MNYRLGQKFNWVPMWWKWDKPREVEVEKVYPRGRARLSNGVIMDENGFAMIYDSNRCVGKVIE